MTDDEFRRAFSELIDSDKKAWEEIEANDRFYGTICMFLLMLGIIGLAVGKIVGA